ncbi:MAG: hypothetical protein WCA85_08275 [Paraburkholderia sp.]|uniref:hypothetical protein n=1 Tax=Paraburkholderia sp. TaxID=1926495 RepID=UPI003C3B3189
MFLRAVRDTRDEGGVRDLHCGMDECGGAAMTRLFKLFALLTAAVSATRPELQA